MPRLGPAWRSSGAGGAGRGFQPPPAVPDEKRSSSRERSGSMSSSGGGGGVGGAGEKNLNPFAMLDDEEDGGGGNAPNAGGERNAIGGSNNAGGGGRFANLKGSDNSSSSTSSRVFHRASSAGTRPPGTRPGGRSLADLAAGLSPSGGGGGAAAGTGPDRHNHRPDHHHNHRGDHHHHRGGDHDHHRVDHRPLPRSSSTGVVRNRSGSGSGEALSAPGSGGDGLGMGSGTSGAKVIRYTREKLLSLRGRGDEGLPEGLEELEGSVVLSKEAQDPVCWDTFDSEEIWAQAARDRRASPGSGLGPTLGPGPGPGLGKGSTGRLRDFDSGDEREVPRGIIPGHRGSTDRGSDRVPSGGFGGPSGGGFGGGSSSGGRWQRGVAVPEGDTRPSSRGHFDSRGGGQPNDEDYEASDPDDLWDDPGAGGGTGAAADFSAFGGSLDDDRGPKGRTGMDAFELSDMSKAAAAFESELHGDRKSDRGGDNDPEVDDGGNFSHNVDPSRPLASSGTTIRGGSGDGVNVFEDFGDEPGEDDAASAPPPEEAEEDNLPIKSGSGENQTASSRLMMMIGVAGTGEAAASSGGGELATPSPAADTASAAEEAKSPEEETKPPLEEETTKPRAESTASAASVPSNPWGAPASSVSRNPWGEAPSGGIGMGLDSFGQQQQHQATNESEVAAAAQRQREEEILRQKKQREEEEKVRWAAAQKQQAEMQAKQQEEMRAAQQRQEQLKAQQNQVELVLVERISNILENSWGRSDLNSILSTLHANDSRVIAILSTVEALRALIARHPQRIQLGRDPTMGAEMAALRLTNAQWQSQQTQIVAIERARREAIAKQEAEMQRQRQLQEEQARQQQEAVARAQQQQREVEERKRQEQATSPPVIANAPWYYADPQGNIQGPFAGDEMRQWLEAGYFKNDLPISQNAGGPFRRLGSYFSDSGSAFQPPQPTEEERAAAVEAKARAEAEARAQALRQQQQQAESEAKERAQAEAHAREAAREKAVAEEAAARQAHAVARAEAEAKAKARAAAEAEARAHAEAEAQARAAHDKAAADRNEQSAQLKMMLGLGAGLDGGVIAGPPQPEPAAEQPPTAQPQLTKKGNKSQKQPQPQLSETVAVTHAAAPEPTPAAPPAPAWGGAAVSKPVVGRMKSMSEIQQEEAREAARRAREQGLSVGGGQRSGGGWANIAASGGSTAWGGAVVKTGPAAVVMPMPVAVAGLPTQKTAAQAAWNAQPATTPAVKKQAHQQEQQKGAAPTSNAAAVDNFGANGRMDPTLELWCRDQMRRLNGSDDLTLVSFCMTLTDRDEIRQYLTAYLGSTPAVSNFATDFIQRKGGENGKKEEEWESAGGSKKGRKKKQQGK